MTAPFSRMTHCQSLTNVNRSNIYICYTDFQPTNSLRPRDEEKRRFWKMAAQRVEKPAPNWLERWARFPNICPMCLQVRLVLRSSQSQSVMIQLRGLFSSTLAKNLSFDNLIVSFYDTNRDYLPPYPRALIITHHCSSLPIAITTTNWQKQLYKQQLCVLSLLFPHELRGWWWYEW